MGGRIASLVADRAGVRGLICLGYPFHPPGKPDVLRTEHLERMNTPTLIVQGSRDAFGSRDEIDGYKFSPSIKVVFLEDGDHSFNPRKQSGRTADQNMELAVNEIQKFIKTVNS